MASVEKYTHSSISALLRHNDRMIEKSSNADIDSERSALNYSFETQHNGLSDFEYYKKLVDEKYIYGRGTSRENQIVTGCSWVVTAPQEIVGDSLKEREFFKGVYDFVSSRYGSVNIINNAVHYDEAGSPHIHIMFCPVTTIDHEKVHYKSVKTTKAVRLDSGRYEFESRLKLDEYGERIRVKNYSRMVDHYDEKISANDVVNKAELQNFHKDLQKYLESNGIEGRVVTGKTGAANFTVKELKEFTEITGMRLDELKEMMGDKSLLQSYVEQHAKINLLDEQLSEKNALIESLREQLMEFSKIVSDKERLLAASTDKEVELSLKLNQLEETLAEKQQELERLEEKAKEQNIDKEMTVSNNQNERVWGQSSENWGERRASAGWGTSTKNVEEEKTW